MKKKFMTGIYIVMVLITCKLVFNYFYNAAIIHEYNNYNYSENVEPLLICNWFQPYIVHYNNGNIKYQNGNYEDAIAEYQKALKLHPSQKKECSIRINLALAMIAALGEDYNEPDNVENSIAVLKEARAVLLAEDCATEDGTGHSETAEQLKDEIDAMIRALENPEEAESEPENGDEDEQKEKEQKEAEENFEQDVKKTLQERQSESNQERKESLDYYDSFERDYNFDYDGYIW